MKSCYENKQADLEKTFGGKVQEGAMRHVNYVCIDKCHKEDTETWLENGF